MKIFEFAASENCLFVVLFAASSSVLLDLSDSTQSPAHLNTKVQKANENAETPQSFPGTPGPQDPRTPGRAQRTRLAILLCVSFCLKMEEVYMWQSLFPHEIQTNARYSV